MSALPVISGQPLPKGADAADFLAAGWTTAQVVAWLRERVVGYQPPLPVMVVDEAPPPVEEAPPLEAYDEAPPASPVGPAPFRFLGHLDGDYYYLPESTRQVVRLTAANHKSGQLLALAPIDYWSAAFASKSGIDWTTAAGRTMQACASKGFFSADKS
ncbi:MAG: hypothetical protein NUW09_10630, partial [Deltaproteobacteria bacterium]|nr:hypothetical protein [Deltaproteobacteria bacterium]